MNHIYNIINYKIIIVLYIIRRKKLPIESSYVFILQSFKELF